jgi:hypothetical protein
MQKPFEVSMMMGSVGRGAAGDVLAGGVLGLEYRADLRFRLNSAFDEPLLLRLVASLRDIVPRQWYPRDTHRTPRSPSNPVR